LKQINALIQFVRNDEAGEQAQAETTQG